jgi:hypothetical protein
MLEISALHYQIETNPPILTNICRLIPPEKILNGFYRFEVETTTIENMRQLLLTMGRSFEAESVAVAANRSIHNPDVR